MVNRIERREGDEIGLVDEDNIAANDRRCGSCRHQVRLLSSE